MYYRLSTDEALQNVYITGEFDDYVSFISGAPLNDDLPSPFTFSMEVDAFDDDFGDDDDEVDDDEPTSTGDASPRMFAYFPNHSLMHRRLVDAMRRTGVDNLQLFPALIRDPATGTTNDEYFVANVIGLVSCANVTASTHEPLADVYFFHELVIDPTRTRDLLLFRLAESQMDIIIHEDVARGIREANLLGIVLEPLREEVGGRAAV